MSTTGYDDGSSNDGSNKIYIDSSGNFSNNPVTVNNGGEAKFEVTDWPMLPSGQQANVCNISFVTPATFSYDPTIEGGGGGTIKVGS